MPCPPSARWEGNNSISSRQCKDIRQNVGSSVRCNCTLNGRTVDGYDYFETSCVLKVTQGRMRPAVLHI